MLLFVTAVVITRAQMRPNYDPEVDYYFSGGMGVLALFFGFRAIRRPPIATVDAKGITYHGLFLSDSLAWSEMNAIELSWGRQKSMKYKIVRFIGPKQTLEIDDRWTKTLVKDLVAHISTRSEAQNLVGAYGGADKLGADLRKLPMRWPLGLFE